MKKTWRQMVQYFSIAGMECCWLYIWLALLDNKIAEGSLSPIGLLLIYGVSFGFNRLLRKWQWPKKCSFALNALLWLATLLAMIKIQLFAGQGLSDSGWLLALPRAFAALPGTFGPELLIFFFSIILWVLGFRLARTKTGFDISVAEFQIGLAFLLIAFLLTSQMKIAMASSVLISLAFIAFALLGVAIAHGEQGNSWLTSQNHGRWVFLLFVVIALVIVLGLVISAFVTPDVLEMALIPFKLLWGLVVKVMTFIAHLVNWDNLLGKPVKELMGREGPVPPDTPEVGFGVLHVPIETLRILRFATGIIWVAVLLFAIWRMFSVIFSWLRRRAATAGSEMESLNGAFKEDLLSLLRRILRWLFSIRLPFLRKRVLGAGFSEVATVRGIYRQLLSWAAAKGWPRVPFQTPYEYLFTLQEALPPFQGDFNFITNQYVRARYGSVRPDENELSQLKKSWHRIKNYEDNRANSNLKSPNRR